MVIGECVEKRADVYCNYCLPEPKRMSIERFCAGPADFVDDAQIGEDGNLLPG